MRPRLPVVELRAGGAGVRVAGHARAAQRQPVRCRAGVHPPHGRGPLPCRFVASFGSSLCSNLAPPPQPPPHQFNFSCPELKRFGFFGSMGLSMDQICEKTGIKWAWPTHILLKKIDLSTVGSFFGGFFFPVLFRLVPTTHPKPVSAV